MIASSIAPWIVAVAQPPGDLSDEWAVLEQASESIVDAGRVGARLVVFPSILLPGRSPAAQPGLPGKLGAYRDRSSARLTNAKGFPSEAIDRICRMAQRARVCVVIGVLEWSAVGEVCTRTLLAIDAQGRILGTLRVSVIMGGAHRWRAAGAKAMLRVFALPEGPVRTVIGAEHAPGAPHALLAGQGAQIYIIYGGLNCDLWPIRLGRIARAEQVFVIGCNDGLLSGKQAQRNPDDDAGSGNQLVTPTSILVDPSGAAIASIHDQHGPLVYAQIDLRQRPHSSTDQPRCHD